LNRACSLFAITSTIIAAAFFCAKSADGAEAAPGKSAALSQRRMIVVVADRTGLSDWSDPALVNFRSLVEKGSLGLMVTRTDSYLSRGESRSAEVASFLTLNAGLPAGGNNNGRLAYGMTGIYEGRPAAPLYSHLTGAPIPEDGIMNLGIISLLRMNQDGRWNALPGALGDALRSSGLRTAAIGNSDRFGVQERSASIIAMDSKGFIDHGNVSAAMVEIDLFSATHYKTNYKALFDELDKTLEASHFIVVDLGDAARLGRLRDMMSDAAFIDANRRVLLDYDAALGEISKKINPETTQLILISPTPPANAAKLKQTLTPLLLYGAGVKAGTALTSSSTRRPGLARNTDFAPHVCGFFGIEAPVEFIGSPLSFADVGGVFDFISEFHARNSFVESRFDLLKGIVVWHLIVLVLGFLTVLRLDKAGKFWRSAMTAVILWTASMFFVFLILGAFPQFSEAADFSVAFFAGAGIVAALVWLAPGADGKMMALSALYMVALLADQLTGASLIKNSVLGYYPQMGARFYGVGNEYMGIMIGAPLAFFGLLLDRAKSAQGFIKWAMALVLAVSAFVIGAPFIGANFGGLISSVFAFALMAMLAWNLKLSWKTVIAAGLCVAALAGLALSADYLLSRDASHVGSLVGRVVEGGGPQEFFIVAGRKLAVNFRLLRVSFWSALFIGSVAVALSAHYFPAERVKSLFSRQDFFRKAYLAALGGALAAFAANDSGIVPGATTLMLPTAALFIMLFNGESRKDTKPRKRKS